MENNINNLSKEPLELERKDKLKFYGILALRRGELEAEIVKKNLMLAISVTYTDSEAIMAARIASKSIGLNPDEYLIPALMMKANVEEIIRIPEDKAVEPKSLQPQVIKVQKSNQDMIAYVRLVFDSAGTLAEKKVAEKVIKRFEEQNKND